MAAPELRIVEGYERVSRATTPAEAASLIADYNLPWETVPSQFLTDPGVWDALLSAGIGITALIRNLGRLTRIGLIAPLAEPTKWVASRLTDQDVLRDGRVHPLTVLDAFATYGQGHGVKGSSTWTPVPAIVGALDEAFYLSFGAIEPANKRTLVGLDVSGSMTWGTIAGSSLQPFQAAGAMAMTVVRTEPEYHTMAFAGTFQPLALTPSMRLDGVLRAMGNLSFGRTDCALPMTWAASNRVPVDTFIVFTDNETWAGGIHPFQALRQYRELMGIPARLAVVGMTSSGFSIADPSDGGMLDLVGFDLATPNALTAFSRGDC